MSASAFDALERRIAAPALGAAGGRLDADALREFLSDRVAKWWIPEHVEFIDEVPKTSVGKFSKKTLRERFS